MKAHLLAAGVALARDIKDRTPLAPKMSAYFSMWDNELVNDITERFSTQPWTSGNPVAQVQNKKLSSTINTGTKMVMTAHELIKANKPFCVSARVNFTNIDAFHGRIAGVWPDSSASGGQSWMLFVDTSGAVNFAFSANGTTYVTISTPAGKVPLNTERHIAAERDADGNLTIYVNGVVSATGFIPGNSFSSPEQVSVRRGATGTVWDLIIARNIVYGGPFTPPTKLARFVDHEVYDAAVAADIVMQIPLRRDDPCNEVNGIPVAFLAKTSVAAGAIYSLADAASKYQIAIDYFGAGDFTYECRFRYTGTIAGEGLILPSHWGNGSNNDTNNRYFFAVRPDGSIGIVLANSSTAGNYTVRDVPAGTVKAGVEYHFVVERYQGTVKVFVNEVEVLSWSQPAALWATTGNLLRNWFSGTGHAAHAVWDIRVAKRALYKHVVATPVALPKMPVDYRLGKAPYTMLVGSIDSNNGVLKGFAKNFIYADTAISMGELYPQIYYNQDTGQVVRIKAILTQGNQYFIVIWAPTTIPYSEGMPVMTNRIRIGGSSGTVFNLASGTPVGKKNSNDSGWYYSTSTPVNTFVGTDEVYRTIEFI